MADISSQITAIQSARYGEEVRGALVTALTAVNNQVEDDTTSAGASATAAAESLVACQGIETALETAVQSASDTEAAIEAAEALRVTAEEDRVAAESARVAAETAREAAETGYVAQAQAAAAQAQQYASSDYVKTAQSWAVGGTSSRYGEDTNNAKYWSEVAAEVVTHGGVGSFNGRTGQVVSVEGDYDTTKISRGTGTAETALASIENSIGSTALPTTAQTLTGAIAEHESDISTLNSNFSSNIGLYNPDTDNLSTSFNIISFRSVSYNNNTSAFGTSTDGGVLCKKAGVVKILGIVKTQNLNASDVVNVAAGIYRNGSWATEAYGFRASGATTITNVAAAVLNVQANDIAYLRVANETASRGKLAGGSVMWVNYV
jgi:hypothetical protein